MSDKTTVVVFGPNGARILTNPDKSEYVHLPHLVDPNRDSVQGLPPHMWELSPEGIVPASDRKVEKIEAVLHPERAKRRPFKAPVPLKAIALLLVNAAVAYLIVKGFK